MKRINYDDIAKAAQAFQNAYDADYEYGISDEDTAKGLIAALTLLGLIDETSVARVLRHMKRLKQVERLRRERRERERRAKLTPEQRAREDERRLLVRKRVEKAFMAQATQVPPLYRHWFREAVTAKPSTTPTYDPASQGAASFTYSTFSLEAKLDGTDTEDKGA